MIVILIFEKLLFFYTNKVHLFGLKNMNWHKLLACFLMALTLIIH